MCVCMRGKMGYQGFQYVGYMKTYMGEKERLRGELPCYPLTLRELD